LKRFTLVTLASLAACVVLAGMPTAASADPAEPTPGLSSMGPSPAGANDWDCKPSLEHPRPVVLVHGTGMSMTDTWDVMAPQLADLGYCVFALNYGGVREILNPNAVHWGITDIASSAEELAMFVDSVKFHTGTTQVDISVIPRAASLLASILSSTAEQLVKIRRITKCTRSSVSARPTTELHSVVFKRMHDRCLRWASLAIYWSKRFGGLLASNNSAAHHS